MECLFGREANRESGGLFVSVVKLLRHFKQIFKGGIYAVPIIAYLGVVFRMWVGGTLCGFGEKIKLSEQADQVALSSMPLLKMLLRACCIFKCL